MTTLDADRVITLLRAVDDELPDGPPIHVRVGGGVGMMSYDPGRLTDDVDMFDRNPPDELLDAAARVAKRQGLPDRWLNNQVARFGIDGTGFELDPSPLFSGRRLVVHAFDTYALLALKLRAGRGKDTKDILMLMRATGITTPDGLRRVLDDYFAGYGPDNWAYINTDDLCAEYNRTMTAP